VRYYSIGEFAELIGKTTQTLRNWDKQGVFKPHHVTDSGYRYYSQEQLHHFLGIKNEVQLNRTVIGYCRVSSLKQKDDLERQIDNVKAYMFAKGYQFEIVTIFSCRLQGKRANKAKKMLKELIESDTCEETS
jgi:predicted site-specific integrase-resolvase